MSSFIYKIGDKGMYNIDIYWIILFFDMGFLFDDVIIMDVFLKIYCKFLIGNILFLKGDIKSGVFGISSVLE